MRGLLILLVAMVSWMVTHQWLVVDSTRTRRRGRPKGVKSSTRRRGHHAGKAVEKAGGKAAEKKAARKALRKAAQKAKKKKAAQKAKKKALQRAERDAAAKLEAAKDAAAKLEAAKDAAATLKAAAPATVQQPPVQQPPASPSITLDYKDTEVSKRLGCASNAPGHQSSVFVKGKEAVSGLFKRMVLFCITVSFSRRTLFSNPLTNKLYDEDKKAIEGFMQKCLNDREKMAIWANSELIATEASISVLLDPAKARDLLDPPSSSRYGIIDKVVKGEFTGGMVLVADHEGQPQQPNEKVLQLLETARRRDPLPVPSDWKIRTAAHVECSEESSSYDYKIYFPVFLGDQTGFHGTGKNEALYQMGSMICRVGPSAHGSQRTSFSATSSTSKFDCWSHSISGQVSGEDVVTKSKQHATSCLKAYVKADPKVLYRSMQSIVYDQWATEDSDRLKKVTEIKDLLKKCVDDSPATVRHSETSKVCTLYKNLRCNEIFKNIDVDNMAPAEQILNAGCNSIIRSVVSSLHYPAFKNDLEADDAKGKEGKPATTPASSVSSSMHY